MRRLSSSGPEGREAFRSDLVVRVPHQRAQGRRLPLRACFVAGDAAHVHSPAGGEGMNTGMQDAFNLPGSWRWRAWNVWRGAAGHVEPERSGVGDEVLKNTSRLTAIGTLHNPIAEELRNIVGRVALGLAPVQHAVVDNMSQVSVGYPESPMNGRGHGSFPPSATGGGGASRSAGRPPFGAGDTPRFTMLALPSPAVSGVLSSFPKLLNEAPGPPA